MYKFMNLWKIRYLWNGWRYFYDGYPWEKFFKPEIGELIEVSFINHISILTRQANKLLPIGHRWRGDVGC